jgi:hypothetical protein
MSDDIEKARAAHAALIAAKAACDAAGLTIEASLMRHGDALAQCIEHGVAHVASMERRAVPIAVGDEVTVVGINDRRNGGPTRERVVSIGRTLIHLGDGRAYRIEDGRWNDRDYGFRYRVDPDDLARIKRDLVGKRPPKPAPTMREVATVTKAGDK